MKIAIHNAQFSYHLGGTERAIYNQVRNLLKMDPNIIINLITTRTNKESIIFRNLKKIKNKRLVIKEFDIKEIHIDDKKGENSPNKWHLDSLRFGLVTSSFYLNNSFDLVIVHFSTDVLFIPEKFKTILNLHGVPENYSAIDESSLRRVEYIIYTTKDIQSKFVKLYPFIKEKKSRVVYLGIERDCKLKCKKRDIDLSFVGRLIHIKGVEFFIKAIDLLQPKYPSLKIYIVGKGPEEKKLKNMVEKRGLGKNICFISDLPDKELVDLYRRSKILVIPSFGKEGIVLSMLEGASHGCCIVASDCCGMPEFVKDKKNGLLFAPQNEKDLSNKLDYLLTNGRVRTAMGIESSRRAVKKWTNAIRVEELYNFYLEVKND